jgi:glutaminyl-tRNA synthetase
LSWISVDESFDCEVRNFGLLFTCERPGDADDYLNFLNPNSLEQLKGVKVHKDLLKDIKLTDRYQFERKGYYCLDKDTDLESNKLVWNLTVGLVDNRGKK